MEDGKFSLDFCLLVSGQLLQFSSLPCLQSLCKVQNVWHIVVIWKIIWVMGAFNLESSTFCTGTLLGPCILAPTLWTHVIETMTHWAVGAWRIPTASVLLLKARRHATLMQVRDLLSAPCQWESLPAKGHLECQGMQSLADFTSHKTYELMTFKGSVWFVEDVRQRVGMMSTGMLTKSRF